MCRGVKVLVVVMILAEIKSDSSEDLYVPSTIIFHDIYTNNLATVTDNDVYTTTENYNIDSVQTQYVEFRPVMSTEKPTIPPPRYILDSNALKESLAAASTTTSTTTEDPEDAIKVVPVKNNYQRGLLDLLFPPKRVKTFKNVFDSFRRVLSHTFRR